MSSKLRPACVLALAVGLTIPSVSVPQSLDILLNCSSCHSLNRDDRPGVAPIYPVLNGQPARYIARQLEAYRTGLREHPQMSLTAEALGEGGESPMARMYAYAPVPDLYWPNEEEPSSVALSLVEEGAWDRGIAPCSDCHSMESADGIDMAGRTMPRLHGQPQSYLARTLREYADGSRQTGPMGRMQAYASALDPDEIDALAAYYATFREGGN